MVHFQCHGDLDLGVPAYLTSIQETTDCIFGLLKKIYISTTQKPCNKIATTFKFTKDEQIPTQKSCIYKIPCSCCNVHICQISLHISTTILEHIKDIRLESVQSVVAKHFAATKHSISFERTEVTANIQTY
jgi:hypothetical protein